MARIELGPLTRTADTLCQLSLAEPFPASGVQRVRSILELFVAAAATGMFSGDAALDSTFEEIAPAPARAGEHASWRYLGHGVDPGAFRVLGNLLNHHVSRPSTGLQLSLRTVGHQVAPPALWAALRQFGYPPAPVLPFEFEDTLHGAPDKDIVVRIEFDTPPPDDVIDKVYVLLDAWELVVMHGGFADLLDISAPIRPPGREHYLVASQQSSSGCMHR